MCIRDSIQPPLYYALVAGWTRLAGTGEWALRFPSVAFGLLMVALAYALGRRLFGPVAGWAAALLGALHPLWVYYAQEARMYTLLTALGMLAGYALLRVLASTQEPGAARQRLTWWAAFMGASRHRKRRTAGSSDAALPAAPSRERVGNRPTPSRRAGPDRRCRR